MTDHEQPRHGGSFIRQKDGSLKRAGETPATTDEAIEQRMDEARADIKEPAGKASPPVKGKKDK